MSLQLDQVGLSVRDATHIHPTSLTFLPGSLNVLLGPTLSGKTTLMRLMAGLDLPTTGRIRFNGVDVTGKPVRGRNVAMVRAGARSVLGNFIQSNSSIVSQGLLSGTLTTSWALLAAGERGYKISSAGSKKFDGKEAYAITFNPKGGGDLDVGAQRETG